MADKKVTDMERKPQSVWAAHEPALEVHNDIEAAAIGEGRIQPDKSNKTQSPTTHCEDAVKELPTHLQHTIDTLRTIAITLLVLQIAALQTVSTHRNSFRLSDSDGYPATFAFINLFVAHVRLLAVPILFFCAGCEAQMASGAIFLGADKYALCRFIARSARRIWKTSVVVACYCGTAWLVGVWPLPPIDAPTLTPYYSTHDGMGALMKAPMAYALVLLLIDSMYAFGLCILAFRARASDGRTDLVDVARTQAHFSAAKLMTLSALIAVWVYACGTGYTWKFIQPFTLFFSVGEDSIRAFQFKLEHVLYATNSPELHFPLLFIGAYVAGTQFLHSQIQLPAPTSTATPTRTWWPRRKPSALQLLALSLSLSFGLLHCVCSAFPMVVDFLDVRTRPALHFAQPIPTPTPGASTPTRTSASSPWTTSAAPAAYATWIMYAISTIPYALLNTCLTSTSQWNVDTLARYACVGLHLKYLAVPAVAYVFQGHDGNLWAVWGLLVCVGLSAGYVAMVGELVLRKVGWKMRKVVWG